MIELPTLYARDAKKGILQWTISTDEDVVITQHGKLGSKQVTHRVTAEPTNVGRANQRLGPAQAEFEAKAAWDKKIKEGYSESPELAASTEILIPMKAKRLDDKAKAKIIWPKIHCQLKLNGLRCTAHIQSTGVILKSYGQEIWSIPHIERAVALFGKVGDILDGEIYIHGVPLQTLNSWVKNTARPERLGLQYHVYDLPRCQEYSNAPWDKRLATLDSRWAEHSAPETVIQPVETIEDVNEASIKVLEKAAIADGYEGLILRYVDGDYGWDKRSKYVLKWKNFRDSEFLVEDMTSRVYEVNGESRLICDVCVCRNNVGSGTFKVMPRGTLEVKAEYWRNRDAYLGKPLVVRYLERSIDGIPQGNPVGLHFRLSEDMPKPDDEDPWS